MSMPRFRLAFLGLGVMGFPMAGHLAKAGHDVCVFNRSAQKAIDWQNVYGGRVAISPAEAAEGADFVFSCVGNDQDVEQITTGSQGAFQTMSAGSVFVDHTTTSADIAQSLAQTAVGYGFHFLDAPVSGGQVGAEKGLLTIMVGGDEAAYNSAEAVMGLYARSVRRMGSSGAGQLTKMVNQICIAGLVQALAEGVKFAETAGLDADAVIEVISKGAAQSWQMENRGRTMHRREFDFGFAVDWMRKDLGLCLSQAQRLGLSLPVTAQVDALYAEIQNKGGNRLDTSSLILNLD